MVRLQAVDRPVVECAVSNPLQSGFEQQPEPERPKQKQIAAQPLADAIVVEVSETPCVRANGSVRSALRRRSRGGAAKRWRTSSVSDGLPLSEGTKAGGWRSAAGRDCADRQAHRE